MTQGMISLPTRSALCTLVICKTVTKVDEGKNCPVLPSLIHVDTIKIQFSNAIEWKFHMFYHVSAPVYVTQTQFMTTSRSILNLQLLLVQSIE